MVANFGNCSFSWSFTLQSHVPPIFGLKGVENESPNGLWEFSDCMNSDLRAICTLATTEQIFYSNRNLTIHTFQTITAYNHTHMFCLILIIILFSLNATLELQFWGLSRKYLENQSSNCVCKNWINRCAIRWYYRNGKVAHRLL